MAVAEKEIANGRKMEEKLKHAVDGTRVSEVRETLHSADYTVIERKRRNESDSDNTWEDDTKAPEWNLPAPDTAEEEGDLYSKQ